MKTYIHQLAADLLHRFGKDMSRVAVVFPNKRASLFLNRELARQSSTFDDGSTLLWSPSYITISDLFRRHSHLEVADQILLVCRLYDVFRRCTGFEAETLDQFFNWGVLLLSDFDDLDKNMADASRVFQLVTDLHALDNDDYLTDTQRKALREFFNTFNDGHSSMLREKFLRLWSKLHDIYTTFREELRRDNLAYEGMLYRDVCEQDDLLFEYDHYCFVGFNMLQQVEQKLFQRLKESGKALFYWDYDTYYLRDNHEAGHFIGDYLNRFPQAAPIHCHADGLFHSQSSFPSITYLSAPTENLQARYVHDWLLEGDRWKAGSRTAIVMADERLLQTIIRSLPDEVTDVNITTGYPLAQSPIVSLLQHLIELQSEGRILGTDKFRLRHINTVLRHPFSQYVSPHTHQLYDYLNKRKLYYPTLPLATADAEAPEFDEGLSLLFCDVDSTDNASVSQWLMQIVSLAARTISSSGLACGETSLYTESLFRTYQILQRLHTLVSDGTLMVDITTFRRLLMQIIQSTTVPYHGEPIAGIQIMGVLETRCLDFDHVLVLSCNEGNMPKGINDSSFIPHSVRMAYGMTTIEHKVGIYSYYFHRLLQRASDVTLAYNSSTEGLNSGEMSRFMLQLMVESGLTILQRNLVTGQDNTTSQPQRVIKDDAIMRRLHDRFFPTSPADVSAISPSSLSTYLRCQLRYYYQYVMGLREDDDELDEMDNKMFGNIFHKAAELAYHSMADTKGWVFAEVLQHTLKDKSALARYVDKAFSEELFHITDDAAFRPEYSGLQLINRKVILRLLEDLLRYDMHHAPIKILGTERKVRMSINISIDGTERVVYVGGIIDRLDMTTNDPRGNIIRVIDYKTGFKEPGKMASVSDIFDPAKIDSHSDYYLQAMLYACIIRHHNDINASDNPVSPAVLYVQKAHIEGYSPILSVGGDEIYDIASIEQDYLSGLGNLVKDILNPDIPFAPTQSTRNCEYCPFADMCKM